MKIKINPTEEQVDVLWTISEYCRRIYNLARSEKEYCWKNKIKSPGRNDQFNKLPEFKEQNPEFNVVYSKVYQEVIKKMHANYKSFYTKWKNGDITVRPPGFKGRNYFVTLPYNQSGFFVKNNTVSFSHYVNDVPLVFKIDRDLEALKIKQIEIFNSNSYKARGDFYLGVTYEIESAQNYKDNGQYQAIDLGVTKIVTAVNTEGKFFEIKTPRYDKYWTKRIDKVKSIRDHCIGVKKGSKKSKRWIRLHNIVKKMSCKLSNQNKDFQHKLAKKMVENTRANTIIVGDLDIKNMAKPKIKNGKKQKKTKRVRSQNRSTQNQGYLGRFVEFLTYKAELRGKRVIRIDERNTSKMCYVCGKLHNMKLWDRIMICDCGNEIDRDRNSAINIMKKFLSQNALWTSYQKFADNLRQTGLLMFQLQCCN